MACIYTYKGREYTYAEMRALLHDGHLNELIDNGTLPKELLEKTKTTKSNFKPKTKSDDKENKPGVSGEVRSGQEPVKAEPIQTTSGEAATTSGGVQAHEEEVKKAVEPLKDRPAGEKGTIKFADKVSVPFTYKLIEADELHPSHLPSGERNPEHTIAMAQPKERNDLGSKKAQDAIMEAPNFGELGESPNAYFGAPVVNKRGEALQGNNRSIGVKKHYANEGTAYKEQLAANAEKFGFTKDQVESMKNPVLVREVPVDDNAAVTLGNYDVKDLETGGKQRIDAVVTSRKMTTQEKSRLAASVFGGDFKTIKEAIRANLSDIVQIIKKHINPAQYNQAFNKEGEITVSGMDDIESIAKTLLFDNGSVVLPEIFVDFPNTVKKGLEKALKGIYAVEDESKSLLQDIQNAMLALHDFHKSGMDDINGWANTRDLFEGKSPKDVFSPLELKLVELMNGAKKIDDIANKINEFASLVNDKPADMFSEAQKGLSKEEAIKKLFNVEYENDNQRKGSKGNETPLSDKGQSESKTFEQRTGTKQEGVVSAKLQDLKDVTAELKGLSGVKKKIVDQVAPVLKALKNIAPNITITLHKNGDTFAEVAQRLGAETEAALWHYDDNANEIHINLNGAMSNSLLHEAVHPVLDAALKNNPKVLDYFHEQLSKMEFPEELSPIKFGQRYVGDMNQKVEALTEFLSRFADGQYRTMGDKVRELFNKLLQAIGFKPDTIKIGDEKTLHELARKLSYSLNEGIPIELSAEPTKGTWAQIANDRAKAATESENMKQYATRVLGLYDAVRKMAGSTSLPFEQWVSSKIPLSFKAHLTEQDLRDAYEQKAKGLDDFGYSTELQRAKDESTVKRAHSFANTLVTDATLKLTDKARAAIRESVDFFYNGLSNGETVRAANAMINEFGGIEKAMQIATDENNHLPPVVRVAILGQGLNYYQGLEAQAKTEQEATKSAEEWSKLQTQIDHFFDIQRKAERTIWTAGKDYGRAIQFFNQIYKQSGRGIVMKVESDLSKMRGRDLTEMWEDTGKTIEEHIKDLSGKLEETMSQLADKILEGDELKGKLSEAEKAIKETVSKATERKRSKEIAEKVIDVSDLMGEEPTAVRQQKNKRPLNEVVTEAMKVASKGELKDGIKNGLKYIESSEAFAKLDSKKQDILRERYFDAFTDHAEELAAAQKQIGYEQTAKQKKIEGKELGKERKSLINELNVAELIKGHYAKSKGIAESIAKQLQDKYGLSEEEAKHHQDKILSIIETKVRKELDNRLSKDLAEKKARKPTQTRDVVDKLWELSRNGRNIPVDDLRKVLSEKFGIKRTLTESEIRKVTELTQAVNNTGGAIKTLATRDLGRYVTELYPETKTGTWPDTFIALRYASMLSGPTTHLINFASAYGVHLLQPLMDAVNPELWHKAYKDKNFKMLDQIGFNSMKSLAWSYGGATETAKQTWTEGGAKLKDYEKWRGQEKFQVDQLERTKYDGKDRFTPIKFMGKDLNPYNYSKYVFRALMATDNFNTMLNLNRELVKEAMYKERAKGLTGEELKKAVDNAVTGMFLAPEERQKITDKLNNEADIYKRFTGNELSERSRILRERELVLEKYFESPEIDEMMDLAKDNSFNLSRSGMISKIAGKVAAITNSGRTAKLMTMTTIPFTGIVANIGEFMMDTMPMYGLLRSNGYSVSGMLSRIYDANHGEGWAAMSKNFAPNSAMKGEHGSKEYYQQSGRAYLGLAATGMLMGLCYMFKDESEEDFYITGGYTGDPDYGTERGKGKPKYSIKLPGLPPVNYLNMPGVAVPLALFGNYYDAKKQDIANGHKDQAAEFKASVLWLAFKRLGNLEMDQTYLQGVANLQRNVGLAIGVVKDPEQSRIYADEYKKNEGVSFFTKEMPYKILIDQPLSILPQNQNLINQVEKVFDQRQYTRNDYKTMFAYSMGLQALYNQPVIDIFGNEVKGLPGDQGINFSHYFGVQGKENETYKLTTFLAEKNAFPTRIKANYMRRFLNPDGSQYFGYLSEPQVCEYSKIAGRNFKNKLVDIMDKYKEPSGDVVFDDGNGKMITPIQYAVAKAWKDARSEALINLKLSDPDIERTLSNERKEDREEKLRQVGLD